MITMAIYQNPAIEFFRTKVMNPKPQKLDNIILGFSTSLFFLAKRITKR
jgi:hypothetical protein